MNYDNALFAGKLRRWGKFLENYQLPEWNDIPNFGLYMDQVVTLLKDYLNYLPPEWKDEQPVTASAINNYVRLKIMPGPVKKKYYRVHLAYLIMIYTLKVSLSIQSLKMMIPFDISEEEFEAIYTSFVGTHSYTSKYFIKQVELAVAPIIGTDEKSDLSSDRIEDVISQAAIISTWSRLLAEKLILLNSRKNTTDE